MSDSLPLEEIRPLLRLAARRNFRRRLQSRFDESDVVQLTCMEAVQSYSNFRGETRAELLAWLETILRRQIARLDRHHSAEKRSVDYEHSPDNDASSLSIVWNRVATNASGPPSLVIVGERAIQLAQALQQVAESQRRVIELRFIDGLKLREIAKQLDVTIGQAAGLLRRGLESLHHHLPADMREELGTDSKGSDR